MLTVKAIKKWYWVHKWSSLISTVFMLFLAITGLPLIFHHELEPYFSTSKEPVEVAAGTPNAGFDELVAKVKTHVGTKALTYIALDDDHPEIVHVGTNSARDANPELGENLEVDARTGEILGQEKAFSGVLGTLLWLHMGMFAGIPGKLFLGFMTLIFLASVVSGVVVYAPFMRRWSFATVRLKQGNHAKWIDYHKAIGIVITLWALVVGGTGAINTLADLVIKVWQYNELTEMVKTSMEGDPEPKKIVIDDMSSIDAAAKLAQERDPEMKVAFIAFPGTLFTSTKHFNVFLKGSTPLTSRLLKPYFIDARNGTYSASGDLPWYVKGLLVSEPLHFGDYGGMPLKIIWAVLDVFAIIVLYSGAYLWWVRRKQELVLDENIPAGVPA